MATYKPTYITDVVKPTAPAEYQVGTYESKYGDQLQGALDNVINWKYDPMNDANYQALAKIYGARGNQAAKNTLADAASLNGGYGTSYAVSAAQQARNQYNQELASFIPDLEQTAYSRAQSKYSALRDADDSDYGRWRDSESDRQWLYSQNYQKYQDALDQYQWAQNWNFDLYQYLKAQAKKGGGGGGRRRSSGGGGGGYSSSVSSGSSDIYAKAAAAAKKKTTVKKGGYLTAKSTATAQKNKLVRMTK